MNKTLFLPCFIQVQKYSKTIKKENIFLLTVNSFIKKILLLVQNHSISKNQKISYIVVFYGFFTFLLDTLA